MGKLLFWVERNTNRNSRNVETQFDFHPPLLFDINQETVLYKHPHILWLIYAFIWTEQYISLLYIITQPAPCIYSFSFRFFFRGVSYCVYITHQTKQKLIAKIIMGFVLCDWLWISKYILIPTKYGGGVMVLFTNCVSFDLLQSFIVRNMLYIKQQRHIWYNNHQGVAVYKV